MNAVKIKSNDTAIQFTGELKIDGVTADLTGASVRFLLKLKKSPYTAYSLTATIENASEGSVSYTPATGFPTTVGEYRQEWQVTFADSSILTFPSDSYNTVTILDDLN